MDVPGVGKISGDVAWGGNWFFLVGEHERELSLTHVESLTDFTWRIRQAVNAQGFPEVDHIELFGRLSPEVIPATLYCVPARLTTVRPAAPARARNSPA